MKKLLLLTLSVMMGFTALFAQVRVTGTVISSEDGAPIPYVTVVVAGTTITSQTNWMVCIPSTCLLAAIPSVFLSWGCRQLLQKSTAEQLLT